jgi:predicted dehydrogenase
MVRPIISDPAVEFTRRWSRVRVGVGVIGCGTVSRVYLRNLVQFPDLEVLACGDVDTDRAKAVADEYGIPVAGDPSTVLGGTDTEIVVNLTNPAAHLEISRAAIAAGKHVYTEKPIALNPVAGRELLALAEAAGVRIAVAPDTFLGAGLQAALRLIGEGLIGEPLSAVTLMQGPGPEAWHPDPAFLYQPGAGPLFDMGPYNLTVLALVFGRVARVAATAGRARADRTIGTGPRAGQRFPIAVPTHYNVLLDFDAGQSAGATFSFDSPVHRFDFLEITGREATLALPNPNMYEGPSRLCRPGEQGWTTVADPVATARRGVGVLELARAIRAGQPHRTSAANAVHVLDVMAAVAESAEKGTFVEVDSGFDAPALLPEDWAPGG